eukprot:6113147-Prymnesium_polylepis.1
MARLSQGHGGVGGAGRKGAQDRPGGMGNPEAAADATAHDAELLGTGAAEKEYADGAAQQQMHQMQLQMQHMQQKKMMMEKIQEQQMQMKHIQNPMMAVQGGGSSLG